MKESRCRVGKGEKSVHLMTSRLFQDVSILIRSIQSEILLYSKQVEILFSIVNKIIIQHQNTSTLQYYDPRESDQEFLRLAAKGVSTLELQMMPTVKTIKTSFEKLKKRLEQANLKVLDTQPIVKMFDEQMELNFVVLQDELRNDVENFLLIASIILHQPLINFDHIKSVLESIALLTK